MRTRPGRAEPEVYFRIVHSTQVGHNNAPVAAYREQTVEIALGPNGAFENGTIGALTRWLAADRVVRSASHHRSNPKSPKEDRTPRVTELLRKAIEWRRQLNAGEVKNKTEIARREGITRARVTQVMRLLRLSSEFQEQILSMSEIIRRSAVTERRLRPMLNEAKGARQE